MAVVSSRGVMFKFYILMTIQVLIHPGEGYSNLDLGEHLDLVKVLEDASPVLQKASSVVKWLEPYYIYI